jgi:hypothetical protein
MFSKRRSKYIDSIQKKKKLALEVYKKLKSSTDGKLWI